MTATRTTYLSIGGVPLSTHAWDHKNLHVMWEGADVRGEDRIIPFAHGVRPHRRYRTATTKSLELVIRGDLTSGGAPNADGHSGLWANVNFLRTNVVDPVATESGTRTAVLYLPDSTTRSGDVHVLGMELNPISYKVALATIDISIPNGVLS